MQENLTDISIVLDRSGSMSAVKTDTIGGFNAFIEGQRKVPGDCNVSLCQFDDRYDVVYSSKSVKDAPLLSDETFVPRGGTALLDAIGKTIVTTGERLKAMDEKDRPGKVMFVILTDGQENSSQEYPREKIMQMIKHQTDTYKWDFVFIGANQDAIKTGASIGVAAGKSMSYAANSAGTHSAFASMTRYAASARGSGVSLSSVNFTDEDRQQQKQAGA